MRLDFSRAHFQILAQVESPPPPPKTDPCTTTHPFVTRDPTRTHSCIFYSYPITHPSVTGFLLGSKNHCNDVISPRPYGTLPNLNLKMAPTPAKISGRTNGLHFANFYQKAKFVPTMKMLELKSIQNFARTVSFASAPDQDPSVGPRSRSDRCGRRVCSLPPNPGGPPGGGGKTRSL